MLAQTQPELPAELDHARRDRQGRVAATGRPTARRWRRTAGPYRTIIGDPLDGKGGRSLIRDTDGGLFDRDTVYDRAIGPMQFIPTTWQQVGADADNDGARTRTTSTTRRSPPATTCAQGGRNMTIPGDWWGAILSYNDVRRYAQDVFDTADEYGQRKPYVR